MKMVMAVVPKDAAEDVLHALIFAGHTATFSSSRGGVLRQAQVMLMIAVAAEELSKVLGLIRANCHTKVKVASDESKTSFFPKAQGGEAEVGGAAIAVWELDSFETY